MLILKIQVCKCNAFALQQNIYIKKKYSQVILGVLFFATNVLTQHCA